MSLFSAALSFYPPLAPSLIAAIDLRVQTLLFMMAVIQFGQIFYVTLFGSVWLHAVVNSDPAEALHRRPDESHSDSLLCAQLD